VLDKIEEEIGELRAELVAETRPAGIEEELGDLLFACANLARKLDVDPEAALRGANRRFERRFRAIEARLGADGRRPGDATLDELEALWQEAKAEEKRSAMPAG
jgi:ATP diphosphatase